MDEHVTVPVVPPEYPEWNVVDPLDPEERPGYYEMKERELEYEPDE